ncbi:protein-disulfide reductase DsbD N-terminal domain-containing protein [Tenacibaculum sp. Mcav3-52]|uniref:protein-disulfide reductase DsbD domain-containing protein n=1 Tax=Tenacibaculum sp. Mcav3-52 TaxID=2917762 RepID=UPI001EF1BC9E|nr:protein-disulfide reductase DsbD domain-containing protein [Tenacibaculum sp. Mcav3-52]MCG7502031.1 protein-disulfide reductase DsbD N-terminal domain-containing protein [Tenacibaculum sp. Mcav3-52]
MKKIYLILLLFTCSFTFSQVHDPVKWSTSVKKISDKEAELVATATIQKDWHLYSQEIPKGGPIPTLFTFEGDTKYLKKGNTKEEAGHVVDDPIFDMKIKYFDTKATFTQRIRLKTTEKFTVKGVVEYMVCTGMNCLPPKEVELTFNVN